MCPLDGPTGVAIAKLAEQKGVTLISYDRAIFEGSKTYYVSFDNEKVGELIGTGFNQCLTDWKVKSPQVYVLNGGQDTDPNAISFATGYNKVVFGQAGQDGRRGREGHRRRRHAGGRELRPRLGQHQGRHDLPAGVHRQPEDQRHHRGQRRARQRGDHRPQDGRRQGQDDPDHRPGRHGPGHGLGPPGLPVRLRLQGRLQGGPGRRRPWPSSCWPARRRPRPC